MRRSSYLMFALLLAGCQSTQVPLESHIQLPAQYAQQRMAGADQTHLAQWWRNWNDPVLNQLVEQGLAQNLDVQIAQARLREARAINQMADANTGPMVGLSASGSVHSAKTSDTSTSLSELSGGQIPLSQRFTLPGQSINGNSAQLGVVASWEPDIFGQKRSDTDAARFAAMGAQEKLYGAELLVAGDIADNYLQARALQVQQANTQRTIQTVSELLRYVQGRFRAGQANAADVSAVQSKLEALRAKHSVMEAQYAAKVRSIAVLTGQVPQNFSLPKSTVDVLAKIPPAPAGGYPSALLDRRPDIRAYAAQVHAYAARLASAKADLLPRFDIQFLGGTGRIDISGETPVLKGWGSLLSFGITVPLFTNGRIKANIDASDARLQAALLQYDQSILKALGEVDSAYQASHSLKQQNDLLVSAHAQAVKQAKESSQLFRYGSKTLDSALQAQLSEEEINDNLNNSRLAHAQMLINLYKALGGGWTQEAPLVPKGEMAKSS